MCVSKISLATGTRPGCATHVPSCPARTSRNLSCRTFSSACSFAAGSFLIGICAAIHPMACTPRRWQASISRPMPSAPAPYVAEQYGPNGQVPTIYQAPTETYYPPIDYSATYPGYYWDGAAWAWGVYPAFGIGLGCFSCRDLAISVSGRTDSG